MKEIKIAGMSCQHCVASVKSTLEEMGLTSVVVELETGTASFTPTTAFSKEQLQEALDDIGFELESVC